MSSWMQYEASKLAQAEQQRHNRRPAPVVARRGPGFAGRLAAWASAALRRQPARPRDMRMPLGCPAEPAYQPEKGHLN